jgi:hypothetical protein
MPRRSEPCGPVKAVVLESFSSILHLVQGLNVVGLTDVDGCSVDQVDTTGGVHGVGALVSHSHNFA